MKKELLLQKNCSFTETDELLFYKTEENNLQIVMLVGRTKSCVELKRKNIPLIFLQLKHIIENGKSISRSERRMTFKEEQKFKAELQLHLSGSGRFTMTKLTGYETEDAIELNSEDILEILELLENFVQRGNVKMKTILTLNCIEEEEDCVKIVDCDDGRNIAIQLDVEEQPSIVYINRENAIKLAELLLNQYK